MVGEKMDIDILKENITGTHEGYILQTVYDIPVSPIGWDIMKPLLRIPRKISYYFHRNKISEIRRFDLKDDFSKNQYFIKAKDGKFYEAIY